MPATLPTRTLGNGFTVSQIGLGCMGLTFGIGDPASLSREGNMALIKAAYDKGVTLFDTAECYGPHTNEQLLGDTIKRYAIPRDSIFIATKMGIYRDAEGNMVVDNTPERIRAAIDGSLARLQTDYVDLYYVHRIDVNTPIELVAETMLALKKEGKIRHWGLSEAAVATVRRAHAVFPLTAVQNEYSIMCRDVEQELLPTLDELGIGLVAFSPLGRSFLTATFTPDTLTANDFRKNIPRLNGDNYDKNRPIVALVQQWAAAKKVTPAQLSLAWLYAQRAFIVPIPGTTKESRLEENIGSVTNVANGGEPIFTADDLKVFNAALDAIQVYGDRYAAANLKFINK